MTAEQIKFILNGRETYDKIKESIMCFTMTATFNIFTSRYIDIHPDYEHNLLIATDSKGQKEYIDFVDINLIRENPPYNYKEDEQAHGLLSN